MGERKKVVNSCRFSPVMTAVVAEVAAFVLVFNSMRATGRTTGVLKVTGPGGSLARSVMSARLQTACRQPPKLAPALSTVGWMPTAPALALAKRQSGQSVTCRNIGLLNGMRTSNSKTPAASVVA